MLNVLKPSDKQSEKRKQEEQTEDRDTQSGKKRKPEEQTEPEDRDTQSGKQRKGPEDQTEQEDSENSMSHVGSSGVSVSSTSLHQPEGSSASSDTAAPTTTNPPDWPPDLIKQLNKKCVWMRDRSRVETIINNMRRAGPAKLQVISDFDMTLTRFALNGKRCPTTHNILESSSLISEDCKVEMSKLFSKYYPIEIDCSKSVEEKIPHMVDWWTNAHNLLVKQRIRKDQLAQAVRDSGAMLRDEYKVFFDVLKQHSVPLLIFSAGVGDILEEVISEHEVFHPNVRIFSNYMDFDQDGVVCGFKGELIHTFNKREGALQNTHQFVHDRTNVLLLGDSLGDLHMADGVQDLGEVLRVGYLNDKVEERRKDYVESYDIVLENDETLDLPNAILKYVTAESRQETSVPATSQSEIR